MIVDDDCLSAALKNGRYINIVITIEIIPHKVARQSPPVTRKWPIIGGVVHGITKAGLPMMLKYINK